MRRPRSLSAEERRLWAEVARSVLPLRPRAAAPEPEPAPRPAADALSGDEPVRGPRPAPRLGVEGTSRPALPPIAPLERRTARALARGRARPDAVLDLHGLTQAEAHARLSGFLRRSQDAGQAIVLVITGRGAAGADGGERGVLRRVVPHWLRLPELRPVVLGFEEAGPRQGGAGALYVRLRRSRPHS